VENGQCPRRAFGHLAATFSNSDFSLLQLGHSSPFSPTFKAQLGAEVRRKAPILEVNKASVLFTIARTPLLVSQSLPQEGSSVSGQMHYPYLLPFRRLVWARLTNQQPGLPRKNSSILSR